MVTPAAKERNRRTQQALRERRRANMTRISVWLPRETAQDLQRLSELLEKPYTDLLGTWIRSERDRCEMMNRPLY
jgi:hypothetical protein